MGEMPLSKAQAEKATKWLKDNFSQKIEAAVQNTPFKPEDIYGIACQETAYVWYNWIGRYSPETILARCVLDGSGDLPNTSRSVFPKNTAEFRAKYGDPDTEMLIHEANLTRTMRGYKPLQIVYKGYGLLQYDIQAILTDESFFLDKKWYSFDECLDRCLRELKDKYAIKQDKWAAIKAYNGSGQRATDYANNVTIFSRWATEA